ncbi:MAG: TetR/AcrR family transcriptional regulator [Terriglobia bacterium]
MLRRTKPPAPKIRPNARETILRAAERVFAEKGLDGARTDAIAKAAKVNKALLYYYFKSKNALFSAVIEEAIRESHQRLMEILSDRGSEREVLLRYVEAFFDVLSERPDSYCLFQRFLMANPKVVERLMKRNFLPRFHKLAALIRRGARRGEFRRVDPVQAAHSVHALVIFYFRAGPLLKAFAKSNPFHPKTLEKRKREMIDFIRYGLFKYPEGRTP